MSDAIDHPIHYTQGQIEVIEVIEDWQLSYCMSNAIKYIARADYKGDKVRDLQKAIWYLRREISHGPNDTYANITNSGMDRAKEARTYTGGETDRSEDTGDIRSAKRRPNRRNNAGV